jgi:hypothetical protein
VIENADRLFESEILSIEDVYQEERVHYHVSPNHNALNFNNICMVTGCPI